MAGQQFSLAVLFKSIDRLTGPSSKMFAHLSKQGARLQKTGKGITRGIGLPLAGAGFALGRFAVKFDTSMRRIEAISGATQETLSPLRKEILDIGAATQFTGGQVAGGAQAFTQLGFALDETRAALPGVVNLAQSAGTEIAFAAETVGAAVNVFGEAIGGAAGAGRVADVLAQASRKSAGDVEFLGAALSGASSTAKTFGVSFEQTVGFLGLMANAGVEATVAGTSLRNVLLRMGEANRVYKDGQLDLLGTLENYEKARGPAAFRELIEEIGLRGGPQFQAVIEQGSGALGEMIAHLEGAGGVAAEMGAVMQKGAGGAINRLIASVERLGIMLGDAGFLDWLTQLVDKGAEWIKGLSDADRGALKWLGILGTVGVVLGPAITALGSMLTAGASVISMLGGISAAAGTLGAVLSAPFLPFIAGAALVVAAGVAIAENWDWLLEKGRAVFETVGGWFTDLGVWWTNLGTGSNPLVGPDGALLTGRPAGPQSSAALAASQAVAASANARSEVLVSFKDVPRGVTVDANLVGDETHLEVQPAMVGGL